MYYFDMHSHILPDIDDGARTLDESIKMLDMAYGEGIRYVCATSHYNHDAPLDLRQIHSACVAVREALGKVHPDMQLFLGNEILYSYGVIEDLEQKKALTFNGSRYILVEFYPQESYSEVFHGLQALSRNRYIPVIAHVERLECLWKQWERMDELKTMHIPFQMNTSSIMGSRFSGAVRHCRRLIAEGYIDLLGTDTHNCSSRAPVYAEAAEWIRRECGPDVLRRLSQENPRAILSGGSI